MRHPLAFVLVAAVPLTLLASACSGTNIRQSVDPEASDAGGSGRGGEGGSSGFVQDEGGPTVTDDGGIVLPATCPCPTGSYCDLSTNSCKIGCTDTSQCAPDEICDVDMRTCEKQKAGISGCPIPAAVAADGGSTCNGVTPLGKDVAQTCKMTTFPTAKGGTVRDGVYVLTATEQYSSTCSAGSYAATIYMCGGTWALSEGGNPSSTATVTFSGTTVTVNPTCGGSSSYTNSYDVTATGIILYTNGGSLSGGYADHYTKQ